VLLDPIKGRDRQITVTDKGIEKIEIRGQALEAHHFAMTGQIVRDIWYGPDGQIVFSRSLSSTTEDFAVVTVNPDGTHVQELTTGECPHWSPDGSLIAYISDESGQFEIYVQAFPGPGGKWQISTRGGFQPTWRADGRELYYVATDGRLMAVSISPGPAFAAGVPAVLFNTRLALSNAISQYAPSADGQRFLVVTQEGATAITPLTVVLNWDADMKKR
jgi:hypothetical protein